MPLTVTLVPCLEDNYGFLVRDEETGTVAAVDTPEAGPIIAALEQRGWGLDLILNTHKHGDHIGGNAILRERTGATVIGPGEVAERAHVDCVVKGADRVRLGATELYVIDTGGHTLGHVSYYAPSTEVVFVGDTLFAMGCGRLFEGGPEQMWASLSRLASLPPETRVYCAHEYTLANADFALSMEDSDYRTRTTELIVAFAIKASTSCPSEPTSTCLRPPPGRRLKRANPKRRPTAA